MACGGGRGSELLRFRPACHVLSGGGVGAGTGSGVGSGVFTLEWCEGLLMRIDELRTRWAGSEGGAYGGEVEGWADGVRVVVVTAGCVIVVDCGRKCCTVTSSPGVVEVMVVVVKGPEVVVVEVVDDANGRLCSPCSWSIMAAFATRIPQENIQFG